MKNNIKEWREKRGMQGYVLAKQAKLSPSYLSRMEKGERPISMENLAVLSTILKCKPHELVDMELGVPVPQQCDMNTMTAVVGSVLEAIDQYKIRMSPEEIGLTTGLMYNQAINSHLTVMQIREISKTIIKAKKKGIKPEPLVVLESEKKLRSKAK